MECMSIYCNFDNQACGDDFCNKDKTCHVAMIDNGFCDEACLLDEACDFDGEDCYCVTERPNAAENSDLGKDIQEPTTSDLDVESRRRRLAAGDDEDNPVYVYVIGVPLAE